MSSCPESAGESLFKLLGSQYGGFDAHKAIPDLIVLGKCMGNDFKVEGVACLCKIA
jgi:hypothetical protein